MKKKLLLLSMLSLLSVASVCLAAGLYGGSSSSGLPTRVYVSVTGIDATVTGTTTLYTVPTGKTFYPTTVMIECTSWTAGQTFTASFGGNSATYDDFIDSQTFEFGAINTFLRDSPVNAVVTQAAADVFSISIEDNTTGVLVISVKVYGYLE